MPGPVFLRGDSGTLRPAERSDASFLASLHDDPRIRPNIDGSEPMTAATVGAELDELEGDTHRFVICVDEQPVADCGLVVEHPRWDLEDVGDAVHPEHWENGYATDAVRCLTRFAIEELGLNKVGADADETNPASHRVPRKVGFREEGQRRLHAFLQGEYVDLLEFGLLAEECVRATRENEGGVGARFRQSTTCPITARVLGRG
jgi:ribosomal-protein-alanine N-acetyltransferase